VGVSGARVAPLVLSASGAAQQKARPLGGRACRS